MSIPGSRLSSIARSGPPAMWVRVERVRGSVPREPGASMLVAADGEPDGTIGGGHLEFEAIALARRLLAAGTRVATKAWTLGASLGQCCGGALVLSLRRVDARELAWVDALASLERDGGTAWLDSRDDAPVDAPHSVVSGARPVPQPAHADADATDVAGNGSRILSRVDASPWHVWVFGAGHVGEALVRVLATMPARVAWIDPRADRFPAALPENIATIESDSPAHEASHVPAGADVLVMTHSHALDFDLCVALLARDDLGLVGLIGSETKAASFRARLARRGVPAERIARLCCPIGARPDDGARRDALDRHPGAIAVSVAFDLSRRRRAVGAAAIDDVAASTPGAAR